LTCGAGHTYTIESIQHTEYSREEEEEEEEEEQRRQQRGGTEYSKQNKRGDESAHQYFS
jgi:hypothetical protein